MKIFKYKTYLNFLTKFIHPHPTYRKGMIDGFNAAREEEEKEEEKEKSALPNNLTVQDVQTAIVVGILVNKIKKEKKDGIF